MIFSLFRSTIFHASTHTLMFSILHSSFEFEFHILIRRHQYIALCCIAQGTSDDIFPFLSMICHASTPMLMCSISHGSFELEFHMY
jgi:hypothetical protein